MTSQMITRIEQQMLPFLDNRQMKQLLEKSGKKLNAAVNKVNSLSIKKLTKNSPTIAAMFLETKTEN